MGSLHGPHPISQQLQIKLPVKLARELRVQAGDEFYWRRSDDDPSVIFLIPSEVVERRYHAGEKLEASRRQSASELPTDDTAVVDTDSPTP